ncbi:MAG: hypothetical protein JRH07_17220, partial [Deltaproteobacteria bacterium]|nr:hypothetical protein [Deltaproteobacteria bacterium]
MSSVSILIGIVTVQSLVRIVYSLRLFFEADYCMNSQYDVVLQSGGKPGRDFEICWGAKIVSYFGCRLARRLLPFGIYAPRIALVFVQVLTTVVVFILTLHVSNSHVGAVSAAAIYAVVSSLIHTGTYVCSPENFDVMALAVLASCLVFPSVATAALAGLVLALMISWSKMVDAFHAGPVFFLYWINGRRGLSFVFLGSLAVFLAASVVHYRMSPYYQPLSGILRKAYRYATRTQDRSKKKLFHISLTGAERLLWRGLLREIPVVLFALALGPLFLYQSASGRAVALLAWSAVFVMVLQNKLWPVHFYPVLSLASVLGGFLVGVPPLWYAVVFLFGVSVYHFLKPLSIPGH